MATSTASAPSRPRRETAGAVSMRRVIRSEWIKFVTLRSTVTVWGVAIVAMPVIGMIIAYNTRRLNANLDANDIVTSSTLQGYYLGQLLIGALGVLLVTGDYSTGMIRSTMTAVPRRLPVLVAKVVVLVSTCLVGLVPICFVTFVASQAYIGHFRPAFSLTDPGAIRVVVGTAVYLTMVGLLGMSVGWIVRSTPGSLVSYLGLILVLPVIFSEVLGNWGRHVAEFFPTVAGGSFIMTLRDPTTLHPWPGIIVMAIWVIVLLGLGVASLLRRDV